MPREKTDNSAAAASFSSSIDYGELGQRLRAYRIGASLLARDIAEQLGVSRAVVYRMEQGQIVKIETVEKLAQLLGTSLASLLGVEVEYYSTALGFLERVRQIEQGAERIVAHFEPISLLLVSDDYLRHLHLMLLESLAPTAESRSDSEFDAGAAEADGIMSILRERKAVFDTRRPNIVSLVGLREVERFLRTGLIGSMNLGRVLVRQRVLAARQEVERIALLMENEPMHVKIGLVDDAMPSASFQLLTGPRRTVLAVSPFRLGALPSIRNGIATVTASPEPVKLYEEMTARLWQSAHKGKAGAAQLRKLLDRTR